MEGFLKRRFYQSERADADEAKPQRRGVRKAIDSPKEDKQLSKVKGSWGEGEDERRRRRKSQRKKGISAAACGGSKYSTMGGNKQAAWHRRGINKHYRTTPIEPITLLLLLLPL